LSIGLSAFGVMKDVKTLALLGGQSDRWKELKDSWMDSATWFGSLLVHLGQMENKLAWRNLTQEVFGTDHASSHLAQKCPCLTKCWRNLQGSLAFPQTRNELIWGMPGMTGECRE
jgi:hypothetical protein